MDGRLLRLYHFLLISTVLKHSVIAQMPVRVTGNVLCVDTPEKKLKDLLGSAYNFRYMRIRDPRATSSDKSGKRTIVGDIPLYVEANYTRIVSEEPASKVDHFDEEYREISEEAGGYDFRYPKRRSPTKYVWDPQQWQCDSVSEWKDLGPDYFPRFLRNVRCKTTTCWYNHFQCKPRSFTVKLLKRLKERCVTAAPDTVVGNNGLPLDLERSWVWEEHAVNFCCDCVMKDYRGRH